jgi:hypothetical protein
MLSRDIATGASKLVAALLVARFADGRTATLTYSQSAALLTIEELSAGVYIHFDAIALMSAENDDANRQYRLCGWRRCGCGSTPAAVFAKAAHFEKRYNESPTRQSGMS